MNYTEIIGFFAATFTTAAFVPQVYKTWKTKDVSGLSFPMLIIFFSGVSGWLVYGVLIDSLSMVIGNLITITLIFVLGYLQLRYSKNIKN